MALTRKSLNAMGLTNEQVESIIEMHTETVDALKGYKVDAERLPALQAELDALKSKGDDGFKDKYETEHKAFEDYKTAQTAKEMNERKTAAARKYLESKGITGKNLDIAMRGAGSEISAAELDGDSFKDTAAFDALIAGDFAGLVGTVKETGASVEQPPANGSGIDTSKMSDADYFAYMRAQKNK